MYYSITSFKLLVLSCLSNRLDIVRAKRFEEAADLIVPCPVEDRVVAVHSYRSLSDVVRCELGHDTHEAGQIVERDVGVAAYLTEGGFPIVHLGSEGVQLLLDGQIAGRFAAAGQAVAEIAQTFQPIFAVG